MECVMMPDATAASLSEEIQAAREALLQLCRDHPDRTWHAYELKAAARNGWTAGAMSIALNRLIEEGVFEVDGDCIRLRD
jgi:hypothetical protein